MKIVAGNWKMNTLPAEGAALAQDIVNAIAEVPSDVQLILAPPFTHLDRVEEVIKGSAVALSAQNCADKDKGAYTGEVSAAMLAATGCTYVILGHSERREYYHETSATLNGKMAMALANGLWLMNPYGPSAQARRPLQSRRRRYMLSSGRLLRRNSEFWQRISRYSTEAAASLPMPASFSHRMT